jgi:glucose-6-phosphate 1-epimerase
LHFEEALHTYFAVGDIQKIAVHGLGGTTYIDKTDGMQRKQAPDPMTIAKETDQVHINTSATCEIEDLVSRRSISVEKTGSNTTVVWNPWIEKNRSLADMDPEDWKKMLCVETANAGENAVVVPAGGTHHMRAVIRVG